MTTHHRHYALHTTTRGWTHCVGPRDCSGRAHGGTTTVEVCACGHIRRTESNGRHSATRGWQPGEYIVRPPDPTGFVIAASQPKSFATAIEEALAATRKTGSPCEVRDCLQRVVAVTLLDKGVPTTQHIPDAALTTEYEQITRRDGALLWKATKRGPAGGVEMLYTRRRDGEDEPHTYALWSERQRDVE